VGGVVGISSLITYVFAWWDAGLEYSRVSSYSFQDIRTSKAMSRLYGCKRALAPQGILHIRYIKQKLSLKYWGFCKLHEEEPNQPRVYVRLPKPACLRIWTAGDGRYGTCCSREHARGDRD